MSTFRPPNRRRTSVLTRALVLPLILLTVGPFADAAPTRRAASESGGRAASSGLPSPETRSSRHNDSPSPGTVPADVVTHPFAAPLPRPNPMYEPEVPGQGRTPFNIRAPKGITLTPENTYLVALALGRRIAEYLSPPVSLVSRVKPTALYSRDINRPLRVARAGMTEWIGTPIGVKRVDRGQQRVSLFVGTGGLPLGAVESLATDDTGESAAAVVRCRDAGRPLEPDRIVLCLYDVRAGSWRELGTLPPAPRPGDNVSYEEMIHPSNRDWVPYRVLLTAARVILVPSTLQTGGVAAFQVYDRVTGEAVNLPWDETLAADFPAINVNAVAWRGETVLFGTDIGLLSLNLGTGSWHRTLRTQQILQVAVSAESEAVYAVGVPRVPSGAPVTVPPGPANLFVVKPGELGSEPRVIPFPSAPGDTGILTVSSDGTPWLSALGTFYRRGAETGEWTRVDDKGDVLPQSALPPVPPPDFDPFNEAPVIAVAPPDKIPDEAVIARVLIPAPPPFGGAARERDRMRWIRDRFARWISPPDTGDKDVVPLPATISPAELAPPRETFGGFVPDPDDPRMAFGLQVNTLIRLARKAVPGTELAPTWGGFNFGRHYKPFARGTKVERFPLFDAASAAVTERVPVITGALLPDPTAPDALYLTTKNGARHYNGATDVWTDFAVPANTFPFGFDTKLFYAGESASSVSLLLPPHLFRLNITNPPRPVFGLMPGVGANDSLNGNISVSQGALWDGAGHSLDSQARSGDPRYRLLAPDGMSLNGWQTLTPALPDLPSLRDRKRADAYVATGSVAWFRFYTGDARSLTGVNTVAGYDVRAKRWVAPLDTPAYPATEELYITETGDGGALIGMPLTAVSVLRYRPGTAGWEPLTNAPVPVPKYQNGFRPLLAPDGTVYALTTENLYEYDAAHAAWKSLGFPPPARAGSPRSVPLYQSVTTVTDGAIYMGEMNNDLWRMSRTERRWERVREPFRWAGDAGSVSSFHVGEVATDRATVWATGQGNSNEAPVLIRWDRRARTARFLSGSETGLPLDTRGALGIVGAGDAVLVWKQSEAGVFRGEPGGTRFTKISDAEVSAAAAAPDDPRVVFLLARDGLCRYTEADKKLRFYQLPRDLRGMAVTENAVYVGTGAGAYRFDRAKETWALVPRVGTLAVQNIRRDGDAIVIEAGETTARFVPDAVW